MPYSYTPPSRIRRLDVPQRASATGHSVRAGELQLERIETPPGTLDLTSADTAVFAPPAHALDAFVKAVSEGAAAYTPYRGDGEIRRVVADNVASFLGIDVDPASQLILTPGTQAGLYAALASLVDEGDEVVLVDPDYLNNERNIRYLGGVPRFVPLRWASDADAPELDLEILAEALDQGARVVQLSHPNNPTGAVFTRAHLQRIAGLCRDADAFVIADQLYARLLYDGRQLTHLTALDGMAERTLTTLGPSKTESMSGYRIGVAIAPPELVDRMEDVIAISAIRCPAYAQHVLPQWLVDDRELVATHIEVLQRNRDHAHQVLNQVDGVTVRRSFGTSYMFPDFTALGVSDNEVAGALRRAGLIVNPGYQFGFAGCGHFRICLAQDEETWHKAVATIAEVLGDVAGASRK